MLRRQAQSYAAFSCPRDVHVVEDGSRVGSPAEETVVYLLWEASTGFGCVCPPQVMSIWIPWSRGLEGIHGTMLRSMESPARTLYQPFCQFHGMGVVFLGKSCILLRHSIPWNGFLVPRNRCLSPWSHSGGEGALRLEWPRLHARPHPHGGQLQGDRC